MADIYIDGKKYGQTPLIIPNLLVGSHQIRISKEKYLDYTTEITVKEKETSTISASLEKGKSYTDITITYNKDKIKDREFLGDITDKFSMAGFDLNTIQQEYWERSEKCIENIKKKSNALGGNIILLGDPYVEGDYMVKPAKAYR